MGRNIQRRSLEESGDYSQYFDEFGKCTFQADKNNPYPIEIIEYTKDLFFSGITLPNISKKTDINYDTIVSWAKKFKWEKLLQEVVEKSDKKYVKKRVKKALSEREQMDQKHKGMIQWLQKEIHDEITRKTFTKAEDDRKQVRMKTLKIATDCYVALIREERTIAGVSDNSVQDQIASEYEFNIIGADGNPIGSQQDMKSLLPNQDPHNYSLSDAVIKVDAQEVTNRVTEALGEKQEQAVQQTKLKKVNLGNEQTLPKTQQGDIGIV